MGKVLITGATGNVGQEVLRALQGRLPADRILAGVRKLAADSKMLTGATSLLFDFEHPATFPAALSGCQSLFLLRPPQLADAGKYIRPLIAAARTAGVQHLVFLSVQGVEHNALIPHHTIEAIIRDSGIGYTFLRPAYFMQNFTTTLHNELVQHQRIFLPAGTARFTLVDVRDVGAVAAEVLLHPGQHRNKAYDLTSADLLSFGEMARIIGRVTGKTIRYQSPTLLRFFLEKKKQGTPVMLILVMVMLHYLPRFRKAPPRSNAIETITGRAPHSFRQFLQEHLGQLS